MTAAQPSSIAWSLDIDLPEWLEVPTGAFDTDAWRRDAALVFELLEEVDSQLDEPSPRDGTALDIDLATAMLVEFSAGLPEEHVLVAGLSIPGRWPLPVVVAVTTTGDDPQDLLAAAGAKGGQAIELPIVEYLPDELGDGIRVTRFDLGDRGEVWATVSIARRGDGLDTVLTWRTTELDLVPRFTPHLESLLAALRIGAAA